MVAETKSSVQRLEGKSRKVEQGFRKGGLEAWLKQWGTCFTSAKTRVQIPVPPLPTKKVREGKIRKLDDQSKKSNV
jgi:hypothetical protein